MRGGQAGGRLPEGVAEAQAGKMEMPVIAYRTSSTSLCSFLRLLPDQVAQKLHRLLYL